ncbi:MAG: hemerythrin domain-containing protein [Rubripirellula sp.]
MSRSETQTRRLAVNAAFLKDIKDDNRDLKLLFDQIRPRIEHQQTAINHWPEIIELCCDLRDQLAFHFSLEEAYGYFDDAIDSAPQLSMDAECLRGEHSVLFERICDLADRCLIVSVDTEEQVMQFLQSFTDFQKDFQKHEEAELKLILDAMDEDLGVGD